jgi:pilus assembly protein Flp/PilA
MPRKHKEFCMTGDLNRRLTVPRAKQEGLTTVEYAIAGTLVSLAVVAAFQALGVQVGVQINNIIAALTGG